MSNARDNNELLMEYGQLIQLIPMISDKQYGLALRTLSKRCIEVGEELNRATDPNYRTLTQILVEKKAQLLPPKNEH
ncbi:MAG: hypothetical protein K9J74_10265 [Sulfuritalea sp.]|nr:hypothetical protein [Sulfuritalea sp.]